MKYASFLQKRLFPKLLSGLSVIICLLAVGTVIREFNDTDWQNVFISLNEISLVQLGQALLFVIGSYSAIACYDILAFRYLKKNLAKSKLVFAGLINYAISPNIGVAFLTGSFLRYRLYSQWHISTFEVAKIIAFTNLNLWVGMIPLAGIILTFSSLKLPFDVNLPILQNYSNSLGIILVIISLSYLSLTIFLRKTIYWKKQKLQLPSFTLSLTQILVFTLDWGFAALTLYYLLDLPIAYPYFLGVYIIAMLSGLVSTLPGGLGIFEAVIIFFLESRQTKEVLLSHLLIFRCLYYFLPFAIAVLALIIFEMRQNWHSKRF
ncbi:putative integral membrane protein [Xenococcus sp. PCC 7305]|nr:putative integral membrane protein [Xenococcus sp. PCC 7305]